MNLRMLREPSRDGATLSALYIDSVWACWILEDEVREIAGQPVSAWKVPGDTAIPFGRYEIIVSMSPRFKRRLPLLLNVPGFDGIRIHPGNRASDTEGCLIPGRSRGPGMVMESRLAFDPLFTAIDTSPDRVWITIERA